MEVLKVLLQLCQLPYYRSMQKMHVGRVMRCAVYFGRLEMLKWLLQELSRDPEWTWELGVLVCALQNPLAEVELLKWLCENSPPESQLLHERYTRIHFERGNLDVIRYLHQHNFLLPASVMDTAATNGHLEVMKFLHELGTCARTTAAMDEAAKNDYLDVVRFLHDNRSEGCTTRAMDEAARGGFLEMVRFLHENRSEGCTHSAMNKVVKNGHLEIVRFLRQHCTEGYSISALSHAVKNGDLGMLRFLYKRGSLDHFESLEEYSNTRGDSFSKHSSQGARVDRVGVVQFLHEDSVRLWNCCVTIDSAAQDGYLEVVKFLHENCRAGRTDGDRSKPDCSTSAMNNTAQRGHTEVVRFLHEHRTEGCTTKAMDRVAAAEHLDIVRFLHEG